MKKVSFHNYLEDLEKENEVLKKSVLSFQGEIMKLKKENEKFKEALTKIAFDNLNAIDCERIAVLALNEEGG